MFHSEHRVERSQLSSIGGRVRTTRRTRVAAFAVLYASAPHAAAREHNHVEAVGRVEEVIARCRSPPFARQPTAAPRPPGLEGGLATFRALEVFLHMTGADAADAKLPFISIVLHHMNKAHEARLAHLAEVVLLVEFLDVDATLAFAHLPVAVVSCAEADGMLRAF